MRKPLLSLLLAHLIASYAFWAVLYAVPQLVGVTRPQVMEISLWLIFSPVALPGLMGLRTITCVMSGGLWPTLGSIAGMWIAYLVPLVAAYRLLDRRRRVGVRWIGQGRCWRCGYDLRATPERCPECGMAKKVTA